MFISFFEHYWELKSWSSYANTCLGHMMREEEAVWEDPDGDQQREQQRWQQDLKGSEQPVSSPQ